MLFLWIILSPFAAASGLRSLHFGNEVSARTLFQIPTPSSIFSAYDDGTGERETDHFLTQPTPNPQSSTLLGPTVEQFDARVGRRQDTDNNESEEDSVSGDESEVDNGDTTDEESSDEDSDEPEHSGDDSDWMPSPVKPPKASAPKPDKNYDVPWGPDRGVMQFDCLETPEICQNACYYQNCVRKAAEDPEKDIWYQRAEEDMGEYNRAQSGVKVSGGGTPCNTGPFAQKFWDSYPFNTQGEEAHLLETDEWPMASMYWPDFDGTVENARSLRCSMKWANGRGGYFANVFYEGNGPYATKGKWAKYRNSIGPLAPGDRFRVGFRFDSFDPNDDIHSKIRRQVSCFSKLP